MAQTYAKDNMADEFEKTWSVNSFTIITWNLEILQDIRNMRAGTKVTKMVDNSLTSGIALTGNYLMQSTITPVSSGLETSLPNITFQARNIMVHSKAK
jgi:hypothetical protein